MIPYTKNENYAILANTEDRQFYIQMAGEEIGEDSYKIASLAIEEAERLAKEPEIVGCSEPTEEHMVCRMCMRNNNSTNHMPFKVNKQEKIEMERSCDNYINKNQKALL